jgi:VWFA-related protein
MAHYVQVVITFLFVALVCSAQESSSATVYDAEHSESYKLRQSVRTVVLDVSVVDTSGRPVAGLKAGDFQITEEGVPQPISFFQGQDQHALPPMTQELNGTDLVERSGQAPLTILLMDEISTEPEDLAFARKQVAGYLAKQPAHLASPTMLLALTGKNLKRLADYTTDRDVLITAIRADNDPPSWYVLRNRQVGFKSTNLETAGERLGIYLATLNELAAATEPYRTRKNIIWVGPGLPALDQTVALNGDQQRAVRNSVHSVVTNLMRARVTLYTVDPQGLIESPTQVLICTKTPLVLANSRSVEGIQRKGRWPLSSSRRRRVGRSFACGTTLQAKSARALPTARPTTPLRTRHGTRTSMASSVAST